MSFVKSLFKKLGKKLQLKYWILTGKVYKSIYKLPQWNWNQIHQTNNYGYLIKKTSYLKLELDNSKELKQIWYHIYDEFIEEFGLTKSYLELLEAKKRIAAMQHQYIQTGDRSILNMIEIEEMDMKEQFEKNEGVRFEAIVMAIEKRQSMPIDPKEITVYKFNNYLRTLKEQKQNG